MITMKLTDAPLNAKVDVMKKDKGVKRVKMGWLGAVSLGLMLAGCINVNAPSEPIVIELKINITQEVIYRLSEDAGKTIDENAGIF